MVQNNLPEVPTMQRRPGDVVNRNTERLPDEQRDALRWLHAFGAERDLTNRQLGESIGVSESTISRIYGASLSYEGNLDNVCDKIAALRRKIDAERQDNPRQMPFQETSLARHLFKLGKLAVQYNRIVPAWGPAQIGKSRTCKEAAARHLGQYVYCEMPVGGSISNFIANLGEPLRIGTRRAAEARRRIVGGFDGSMLLIVDQMHRLFMDRNGHVLEELSSARLDTLDYIIEIFDAHEPGIMLVGSEVWRDSVQHPALKKFFAQLRGRSLNPDGFQLPAKPSRGDLNLFAAHYGLPPATGDGLALQTKIIEGGGGLAVWLTRLKLASQGAAKRGKQIEWSDVVRADDVFTKIALGEGLEGGAS